MKKLLTLFYVIAIILMAVPAIATTTGYQVTLDQARDLGNRMDAVQAIYDNAPGRNAQTKTPSLQKSGEFNIVFAIDGKDGMMLVKDGYTFMVQDGKVNNIQNAIKPEDSNGIIWRFFPSHHDADTYFYTIAKYDQNKKVVEKMRVNMQWKDEIWNWDYAYYETDAIQFKPFKHETNGGYIPRKETLGLALSLIYDNFFVKNGATQDEMYSMFDFAYATLSNEGFHDHVKSLCETAIQVLREN